MKSVTFADLRRPYPGANWSVPEDIFASDLGMPAPSFALTPGERIFTVGSCFARNIETVLEKQGFEVPMLRFAVPPEERPGAANSILNRYTVPAIQQTFGWAERIYCGAAFEDETRPFLLETSAGTVDVDLASHVPVSKPRAWERRREMFDVWRTAFESDVVVITLGQNEPWLLESRGLIWGRVPHLRHLVPYWPETRLLQPSYEELLDSVLRTIDMVRRQRPATRFLLTVSPVPGARYFNGLDALTSYWWSKSLLRAAAAAAVERRQLVDYFPSFELVHAAGRSAWHDDGIHVKAEVIDRIVGRLVETYIDQQSPVVSLPTAH
jgi:hypothetical protein